MNKGSKKNKKMKIYLHLEIIIVKYKNKYNKKIQIFKLKQKIIRKVGETIIRFHLSNIFEII
jgi:hypothetical protein